MRLPNQSAVTAFIDSTTNSRSSQYHRYLSKDQFTNRFGPSKASISAVENQLRADGLRVTGVAGNRLLVNFTGSAARVTAAFHTGLERVRLAGGELGRAATSALRLPSSIAGSVQAVIGLNQLVHENSGALRPIKALDHGKTRAPAVGHAAADGGPVACAAAQAVEQTGGLTDQQLATAYGLDPLYAEGDLGAGQTVDIYELEPYLTSDVATFDQCYFGASHTSQLTDTLVDGGPGTGPGSGEAALDIDNVSALAPGADIHVFSGPNNNGDIGELDTWNAIAMADDARQVSSSWGLCETAEQEGMPGELQVENEIFEQTAAQGQTIYSSAGDDGSDDCASHASTPTATNLSVDDPASQPYVTSVGGTTITDATEPPAETVWNNGNAGGGGGGGVSETWAMPPWQTAMTGTQPASEQACSDDPGGNADNFHLAGLDTTLPSGTACRETPDVSALADPQTGYTIVYDGEFLQIGGTSASTPLWAALTAEMNASSQCTSVPGGLGLGFATPLFYQVASSSAANYASAFSDVTVGNNDNLDVGAAGTWSAGTGYDMASGLGTPRVTDASSATPGLDAQLCAAAAGTGTPAAPQVTGLSSKSGPSAGGTALTITGTGFGTTQGSGNVFFGNVDADVTSWSATSIVVQVPAYQAPNGIPVGTAGRAIVTVVTNGHQSSAPTTASVYSYTAAASGAPVVDYVSTSDGVTGGGNTVDIVGSGFTGATTVDFGDVPATSLKVISDNELSVTVPASDGKCAVTASQGICAVSVTVTNADGPSSGPAPLPAYQGALAYGTNGAFFPPTGCKCEVVPAPDEYDYTAVPVITSVSPTYASENGTTDEVITGTSFNLLTFDWANIGPAGPAANQDFSILGVTPTSLTIAIPAAAPTVEPVQTDISVQDAGLPLSNVDTTSFSYAGTPVVTGISKHLAAQADPGNLTITGQGLSDVTSVVVQLQGPLDFLSSTSTAISDQSDTSLTVAIPNGFAFPADVLACSASGCSTPDPNVDALTLAYPGRPVISALSPASGPAHGGNVVEINGALDSQLTAVHFGSRLAAILQEPELTASGPIFVTAPAGTGGKKVSVTISTLGGTLTGTPTSAAVTYTYARSSPTAPGHVTGKAGVRSATISWAAPGDNGGASVTGYVITVRAKGHKTLTVKVSSRTRKATITRLTAGIGWTFELQAVNKYGRGLPVTVTVRPKS